ncbi:retrovirus-related pol polyprotein from transposon TNT 1-94 [Tanacetum coccineum]
MGPPPATPGSEKTVSFQKSILGPRPKHIIVNKVKIPVASDNEVKQFYKPLSKPRVGFSKLNFRSKTPPPRRVNNNYSRPKTPQPKRHVGRQNQPHGFPHDEFEMSMMGELNFFLGLKIKQMEDGIFFNQSKYIKEMLKKFGLEESKPMKTPMSSDTKLMKDEEYESVDSTKYRGMIEAPKTSHLEAVKRIFQYIKGTTHLGLWYLKGTGIETVVYADSDHAGDYVDRKSTSGACVFTDRWRLDELAYGIPSDGPYKPTFLPLRTSFCLFELIEMVKSVASVIRKRLMSLNIKENLELENESYILYDRVMTPLAAQLERKPRRDRGTRRGRHSTSSSSAFDQPSSSHLNDDDDDGNDEGTSRASTPSPIRYVNSLTNQVPQVFQNPPNIDPDLEPFYTRQTEIINRQVQLRDEHRGGVRSIGKSLRRLWRNMKK